MKGTMITCKCGQTLVAPETPQFFVEPFAESGGPVNMIIVRIMADRRIKLSIEGRKVARMAQ